MTDFLRWLTEFKDGLSPIQWVAGGVIGFFVSRWTLSKKERLDAEQKLYENGRDLMVSQNLRFQEFTSALHKYAKDAEPSLENFVAISVSGDTYFNQLMINAEAVLSRKVSADLRDNTIVPRIVEAIPSNLPGYYSTLQGIASRKGFHYDGKLDRKKYEALYLVAEKFGGNLAVPKFSAEANEITGSLKG